MADQQLRFTLDFLAKTAGLKNANELLDQLGEELDDGVDAGKRLAQTMRLAADRVEASLDQTRAAAELLAAALGPEMAAAIGQSRLDNYAAQFQRAGLSVDDVRQNVDELADSIRRLEGTTPAVTDIGDQIDDVGKKTEKTGSVVANFAGNAAQELPGVADSFGPLNVAIGQFAEYATEGDVSLGKFLKGFAGVAVAAGAFGLIAAAINEAKRAQEEMKARTDEVVPALERQIAKSYELAAATDSIRTASDGLAAGQAALNSAIINTGESGEKLREALGAVGVSADDALASMSKLAVDPVAALTQLATQAGLSADMASKLAEAVAASEAPLRDLAGQIENTAEETEYLLGGFQGSSGTAQNLTSDLLRLARAAGISDEELFAVADSLEEIQDSSEKTDIPEIVKQFLNTAYASNETTAALIDQAEAITGLSRLDDPIAVYQEFNKILGESSMATRDAVLGTNELGEAMDAVKASQENFIRRMERVRDRTREADEAQRNYTEAVLNQRLGILDALDAEDRLATALENAATATDDATTPVDEYAAAQREAERAALDVAQSYLELGKETASAAGKTLTAAEENGLLIDSLSNIADRLAPGDPLRRRLQEYIYELDSEVPDEVNTEINAKYNMSLGKLGFADVNETGGIGNRFGSSIGSFVLNVNISNPVMSGEQIAAELAAYLRRSGATFKLFG